MREAQGHMPQGKGEHPGYFGTLAGLQTSLKYSRLEGRLGFMSPLREGLALEDCSKKPVKVVLEPGSLAAARAAG